MIQILIGAIVTWRICSLFIDESGPFDIFKKFRNKIGIQHWDELTFTERIDYVNQYEDEPEIIIEDTFLAEVFSCYWCLSIWVGFLIALYMNLTGLITWEYIFLLMLTSSSGTILIQEWRTHDG